MRVSRECPGLVDCRLAAFGNEGGDSRRCGLPVFAATVFREWLSGSI